MLTKIILFFTSLLITSSAYSINDCFNFKTVHASYENFENYGAFIELERTNDGKIFFISHQREGGFEQSTDIFNEVFNLTESSKAFRETENRTMPFDLNTSSIKGEFSTVGHENLLICTGHYTVNVRNWSLFFRNYRITKKN